MQVMTITPDLAKRWMEKNTVNRPFSRATHDSYVAAMKRGEWKLNGESIKFTRDGRMIDGQHRLRAIITSGISVQIYVVTDLDNDAFRTLDGGKRRSAADVLSIEGEVNAAVLAAATRAYIYLRDRDFSGKAVSNARIIDTIQSAPHLRFWARLYHSGKMQKMIPSAFAGVCALFAEKHGSDVVIDFFEKVRSGLNMSQTDPAYHLREKFISRARGVSFTAPMVIAYSVKALNSHVSGKPMKIMRMFNDEGFPEVL